MNKKIDKTTKLKVTKTKPSIVENSDIDNTKEIKQNESFIKKGFDFKTVLQIFAILISITAILVTIYFNLRKEDNDKSTISVQMGIQPTYQIDSTGKPTYYESWYMFTNNGKATTKAININWFLNKKYLKYSSKPFVMGTNHGVEINIIETTMPGFCEIKIKDLPPNVGFMVGVRHRIKDEYIDEMYKEWGEHMFDVSFSERFLSEISVSGEKVEIKNDGATNLKNMSNE